MVILTYEDIEILMYAHSRHYNDNGGFLYRKLIRIRATMEANDMRSVDLFANPDYKEPVRCDGKASDIY